MKLRSRRLQLKLTHPWKIARTVRTDILEVIVVELIWPDGLVGIGEAAPVSRYGESPDSVAEFFSQINTRSLSINNICESQAYLDSISTEAMSAKCAVNIALHDAAAKRAGKALFDTLGLGFREKQHVTSFTIGIDSLDVIRSKVVAAEQFPVLKVKVGVPDDRSNLCALREVAPHKPIRVDANEGWKTKEAALEEIEWLARDENVQFVEQPLPASVPVKDWVWLKQRSPLPIFGDESYHGAADAERAAECFHGVNVKLVKTGGITGAVESLVAARKRGLKTMLGCMIESSILISAAAHLAELCDYLDLDGNLLISNDPYTGVKAEAGILSFAKCPEKTGLRVSARA